MASFPDSFDKENWNFHESGVDSVIHSVGLLSQPPILMGRGKPFTPLTPFTGLHQFKVWVPKSDTVTAGSCRGSGYGHQSERSCRVYVQRNRRWPLAIAFRPSMTPVAYRLRVLPRFVDKDRAGDLIEICSKHAEKSQTTAEQRSFIHLLSPSAQYVTDNAESGILTEQIAVLLPLDVIGLLRRSNADTNIGSPTTVFDSQSHLLPEVCDSIDCRVRCYNSCLGSQIRGEIDLYCLLEVKPSTDSECPYEVVGMQTIRLHSSACPSRDSQKSDPQYPIMKPSSSSMTECCSSERRRNACKRLSLNASWRSNIQSSVQTVDRLRIDNPSEYPEININGKNYHILLVPDRTQWKQHRRWRNCGLADMENVKQDNLRRISRTYDRLELKIAEKLRQDAFQCSQDSSGSQGSSQCDKATETEPVYWDSALA